MIKKMPFLLLNFKRIRFTNKNYEQLTNTQQPRISPASTGRWGRLAWATSTPAVDTLHNLALLQLRLRHPADAVRSKVCVSRLAISRGNDKLSCIFSSLFLAMQFYPRIMLLNNGTLKKCSEERSAQWATCHNEHTSMNTDSGRNKWSLEVALIRYYLLCPKKLSYINCNLQAGN